MNLEIENLVEFISSHDGICDKTKLTDLVVEKFSMIKDRSVYYNNFMSIRFSQSKTTSFSNTILALSNLQKYDKILTDNVFDHSRFSEFFPEKTFLFDYDIDNLETNIKPINLGIYNHMRKLYFIGDYSQNSDLIRTLIASFISLHRYRENLCIVFFLTDNNTKIVDELKQFSNQAYKQLNIGNVIDKNVFVNINLDEKSIAMCHRTGDVFLDLNEDSNNSYHKKNAEKFGNLVVGRENLNFYTNLVRNNNINFDQYLIASQASIETKIATTLDKPETNTENINGNTLEQLLWN